jgi:tetratricopeptide (TPR) repeat protein
MQTGTHPDLESLEGFLTGELDGKRSQRVAWHLTSCETCREKLLQHPHGEALLNELLAADPALAVSEPNYDAIISESYELLIEREIALRRDREAAIGLFDELMRHPPQRREVLIANGDQYSSWGFCEHLLARCVRAWSEQPQQAIELARLATGVCDRLDREDFGEPLLSDLQARAWAYRANTYRVTDNHPAAERAFQRAQVLLAAGTGDPLEKARVLSLLCSLRIDRGQFDEADQLADRVLRVYRRLGDSQEVARTLIKKARVLRYRNDLDAVVETLFEAVDLIDRVSEPSLWATAAHNLADAYSLAGRYMEARALLSRHREICTTPTDRVQYQWVKARVDLGLGQTETALAGFRAAQDGFLALGRTHDAAYAALELAQVYLQLGMTSELQALATQLVPVFEAHDAQPATLAALSLLHEAAQADTLTASLLHELQQRFAWISR